MNRLFQSITVLFFIFINLFLASFSPTALAQNNKGNKLRQGFPGRRVGAGTRDQSIAQAHPLTALIPATHFSKTIAGKPTLYFYLPKTQQPKQIEVVVRDDQDEQVYKSVFFMAAEIDFTAVQLFGESDALPLEPGRDYHWYFSIIPNPQNRSQDMVVDGWIQRVEVSEALRMKLAKATNPIEMSALYVQEELWYEAVATLAQLRESKPNDATVTTQWQKLLQSVGLGQVIQDVDA